MWEFGGIFSLSREINILCLFLLNTQYAGKFWRDLGYMLFFVNVENKI